MKKPENFVEFCDSLRLPYALAKQYFDDCILNVDLYNDMTFFYEYFEDLTPKYQDTVYNNLQRLYDVTKDKADRKVKHLKNKSKDLMDPKSKLAEFYRKDDEVFQEMKDYIQECLDAMSGFSDTYTLNYKLSVLNEMLNIADGYRRKMESVDLLLCEEKCSKTNTILEKINSNIKQMKYIIPIFSLVISICTSIFIIYVYAKVGDERFVQFFEENVWQIILFPTISTILYGLYNKYKKI